MNARTVLIATFSCALVGCKSTTRPQASQDQPPQTPATAPIQNPTGSNLQPKLVSGAGFQGVIFPADTKTPPELRLYPPSATFWTPTETDIAVAEHALPTFLKQSRNPHAKEVLRQLDSYKRQYRGVVLRGRKQIFIRFFLCEISEDTWMKKETVVMDGGSCFFSLRFSPAAKAFSDLWINGEA
jgi:hypothetical protein